ncbi:nucleolar protein 6 [Echria macrotheca]|uniref:U3 small nucleolar RNA-associated protein 22 n=1 Tax=Echria macrotheca TaxID=438768 RepID=A0AAJ0BHH9_9PEZI|nr:nucleolar protein 6 [Echria macrotheca]
MESAPAKRRKLDHSQTKTDNALQTAAVTGVSRSRAFVLETEELLDEVSLDYATAFKGADELLHKIKSSIESIEPHEPTQITEAAARIEKKHRVKVPFPDPRPSKSSNYKVSVAKPTQFNVVGSYVSKTMVKTQKCHTIDMVFLIPAEILQEKDYLDLRYFYKRAYVLALASAVLQNDFGTTADLSYEHLHGNPLCPVIVLQPQALGGSEKPSSDENSGDAQTQKPLDYRIRIIPCAPDEFFPKSKLHLGASLVRKGKDGDNSSASLPTPFYNSTLVAEGCFFPYLRVLRQAEKRCKAFKNACILGRIWLQQRGFGGSVAQGGFGHFEWALLLALLLQGGENKGNASLSPSLSSTQLFKAMVQFLSVTNFAEKPCVLGSSTAGEDISDAGPVIYDSVRQLNIAFKMSPWSAAMLYQQARWTRNILNDSSVDQFNPCFILKADLPLQSFDMIARLNRSGKFDETAESDCRGKVWQFSSKVYRILKRALSDKELGERARLIHVRLPECAPWPLAEKPKSPKVSGVEVGILFDPTNAGRTVDRGPVAGPSAQEKEDCEKFRRFWGSKAELRRFEGDGIRETVLWSSASPFDLCEEIMRYILNLHLQIGALDDDLTFYGHALSRLLPLNPTDSAVFNAARKAFTSFERDIRDLEDLPLQVRQVAPICPELRHASVKLPQLSPSNIGSQPMEAVISFEASGKWPESLAAIQRTKIAFLLMIGNLLEEKKRGRVKTWVGLEDGQSDIENLAFLDIVYESGASFRLRIHSDLEEALLERQTKDKTVEQHIRTRTAASLATFRRLYTHLPLHTQTISTFVTRFPALSGAIRLLKQWFNMHKLSYHFTDEFIELVALHVFISPYPWDAPSSANTGFFRALRFLAHWDWRSEPLVLDTGGDMPPADRTAIATRLEAWRKIDPSMSHTVVFVATAQDTTGVAYTSVDGHAKPTKVVATRMTALAKSASRVVREQGLALDTRTLFVPSLKEYDVLIYLNGRVAKDTRRTYPTDDPIGLAENPVKHGKFKNLDERTGQEPLPLAQYPSQALLKHLDEAYDGVLVFFRGAADDTTIGAIWNPQAQSRKFKINMPASYKPVGTTDSDESDEEEVDVVLNREGILAEIARVGGDLIEKIDMKT